MPCAETAKLGRSLSVPTARPERSGAGDEAGRDDRAPELFGGAVAVENAAAWCLWGMGTATPAPDMA